MSESKAVEERSILKSIHGIMFFGTPNQGMDITSLIPMVQGQSNEAFVRSLGLDSTELRQQAKQWFHVFQARDGDKISSVLEIISFYEDEKLSNSYKGKCKPQVFLLLLTVLRSMANGGWREHLPNW